MVVRGVVQYKRCELDEVRVQVTCGMPTLLNGLKLQWRTWSTLCSTRSLQEIVRFLPKLYELVLTGELVTNETLLALSLVLSQQTVVAALDLVENHAGGHLTPFKSLGLA